ncbi:MAG TPA: ATPase, T2SS/T4P/T4SS family [archaeon]|nr:ATPase, T2SS/T4P/T4SS family [archaeon]
MPAVLKIGNEIKKISIKPMKKQTEEKVRIGALNQAEIKKEEIHPKKIRFLFRATKNENIIKPAELPVKNENIIKHIELPLENENLIEEKPSKIYTEEAQPKKIRIKLSHVEKKKEDEHTNYFSQYPIQANLFSQEMMQQFQQLKKESEIEKHSKSGDGIQLPDIITDKEDLGEMIIEDKRTINIKYPLVSRFMKNTQEGQKSLAYAHIFFDSKINELVYVVVEPPLDEKKIKMIKEIKEYAQEKLDINFSQIRKKEAIDYISRIFEKAIEYFRINIKKEDMDIIKYYIYRDFLGLEKIEPFMSDKYIEDISCDGTGIPIYIYHRHSSIGSIRSNVVFDDKVELDSFVNKLAERCGRSISTAKPLLDGMLPDGSRIQTTLSSDIARHGSNFTIRMFTDEPLCPSDMIRFGTSDLKMMAYFWFLIEHNMSFLISGGTATGKTSLLNALSMFIRPEMKIVSIEDTGELRLPHSHWISEVARSAIAEEGKVDMFELLRESLRQRPDYIIVGEVRGREAYVLFQQMAVGHAGLSTIHAENFSKLMDRLTSPPIELPPNLIENLDVILFLKMVKQGNRYTRRVSEVIEVLGYDTEKKTPITNHLMKWDAKTDRFVTVNKSLLLKKILNNSSMNENEIIDNLRKRSDVLKWISIKKINDYKKIGKIISLFYTSEDYLMSRIGADI